MVTIEMAQDDPAQQTILKVADTIGGLMELWGFKRTMGRMWAVLYMSPQPFSAQDLGDTLTMSAGAVSMTLQELVKWGVVKKSWRPGERRDYYEPERDIWKMVSRVFRERELLHVRAAIETFQAAIRDVTALAKPARPEDKKRLKDLSDRVESLLQLARIGEALLSAVLAGQRIDPGPIKSFLEDDED
jgi:HTH-type transcriptional regulator, glycine betaine synthesis regulator